jgi:hypothetical protein
LDIKGLAEWEAIKEVQQKQLEEERRLAAEAKAEQAAQKAATAEASAEEAVVEPETGVEPAPAAVAEGEAIEETVVQEQPEAEPVLATAGVETIAADALDQDALLEALLREEESEQVSTTEESVPVTGLSVEELASFTLEDVEEDYEAEGEDEGGDEGGDFQPEMPVLTPDAGKIRFAEDIVGDFRGGGRRDRKSRRGGSNRGARRGPGR